MELNREVELTSTATNGSVVTMTPFISPGDVVEFQKIDQLMFGGITSVTNATNAQLNRKQHLH